MKVRVKFRKYGIMRFIGHLDLMRYFQKAVRRADIDIKYSEGFSPHMIMSFASPLGVGLTSDGEYMDIELNSAISSAEGVERLNARMTEGVEVVSFREIPGEKSANAMAILAAADYEVGFRDSGELPVLFKDGSALGAAWDSFYAQESIPVVKKTKKGERELDIKPLIYGAECRGNRIFMKLSAGSAQNVKPELVMEAFAAHAGVVIPKFALLVHRLEMYAVLPEENQGDGSGGQRFISLEDLGRDI